ncbi:unnamed protein product [Adineta steineri]|uniref:VOC domain-containing protein n=1 Tax=Adineta steineri TaxID=433720 RepID=A0A815BHJ2_9BILA|nr:unnamed protein product [Adineta steineri]
MENETNGFHHIELHTIHPDYILDLFIRIYGFQLIAKRNTFNYSQWFLKSSQCQLLISSVLNIDLNNENKPNNDHYDILTTILNNENTRDFILDRDTTFNVALHVKSVQTILDKNPDVQVLVSRRQAVDEYGTIEYACIKSCIGNVVHTLINTSEYSGSCLPGFVSISNSEKQESNESLIDSIDHIAFAIPKNSALSAVIWYEKVLGMKRFKVNQQDDPFQGFSVHVGTMGMRLFASEYWKCAETACMNDKQSNLKFVFAESLIDSNSNSTDQITKFIANHKNQPGIQHLALYCMDNIKNAVRITKTNGAQYLLPCQDYYLKENNGYIIEATGENVSELAELGILLDDESDNQQELKSNKKVLLQIFTKSIFNNDTFFLELIERRGAIGFGAGNIRTLWKIVQQQIDSRR